MTAHLPVQLVVVPLLAAPLALLLRHRAPVQTLVGIVLLHQLVAALLLVQRVFQAGAVSYPIGGWPPPWGIELYVDALNALIVLLLAMIGAIVGPWSLQAAEAQIPKRRQHVFAALLLLMLAGLYGMTVTGDAFNVFVFLEISALSTYGLVALGPERRSLTAAFRYLMMGTTGSTFFLLGLGFLLMATGTLNMRDLAARIPEVADQRTVQAALAFIAVGLGLKVAVFPLHGWLPNAYAFAPAAVTALVAATATKVGFYLICRYEFVIFGETLTFGTIGFDQWLVPVGVAGMIGGSLAAVFETDLRRLLAQSSVAQLGYMIVGIGLDNTAGATGALVHAFNHALMKGGLFMAAGGLVAVAGSANLDDLRGLGRRLPWTAAAFVIGGLSLVGVPLTVGFVSKWYLVLGALDDGRLFVAGAFLFASLLALVYVWRVVVRLYEPAEAAAPAPEDRQWTHIVPVAVAALLMIVFGLWTTVPVGMARHAAAALGVAP